MFPRYRRPGYGRFPWRGVFLAGTIWIAMTVAIHFESRATDGWGGEGVYLLYVDRELRILEAGEDQSAFNQWLTGADEEWEMLVELRQSMELLDRSNDDLTAEASVCLAFLQFETGEKEAARETLRRTEPESRAGWILHQLLESETPDKDYLEELRLSVEGGRVLAWEARILARAGDDYSYPLETWTNHRAVNATMLGRAHYLFAIDGLLLLGGLICIPFGLRELRSRTPVALPRITGRWTAPFVLGWFFVIEVCNEVLGSIQLTVGSLIYYLEDLSDTASTLLWTLPVLCSQGYGALFLSLALFARPWHAFKAFRMSGPVPWAAILGMLAFLSGLHMLVSSFVDLEEVVDPADILILADVGLLEFGFIFLSGCVAAPLFEEFVYRGVLFLGLRGRIGNVGALVLSSAIFAVAHSQYDWQGVLSVGVFGACCGVLAWRTGSILPGIILHSIYNSFILGNVYVIYQLDLQVPW